MRPHSFDLHRVVDWLQVGGGSMRETLRDVAHHTGLPVVVVAAVGLVASWRIVRHGFTFAVLAVEVAAAVAILLVATRLGWIHW